MTKLSALLTFFFIFCISSHVWAQVPGNDNCTNARLITTDSTCVNTVSRLTGQTLTNATNDNYTITSTCSMLATARDVWYKFVAKTKYPVITISNPGAGWSGIANVRVQLLSGACGSFTEVACGTGGSLAPSLTKPLVEGDTYYLRIHKNTTATIGVNHTFDICVTDLFTKGGRMNEVFSRTVLSGSGVLNYPWEVTYGPDNKLWVTEAKGYKVYRIEPSTGVKTTVLDLNSTSTDLSAWGADSLRAVNLTSTSNWNPTANNWPQGGLAGLAIHPKFLDGTGLHDYVYVSYVHRFLYTATGSAGIFFRNKIVRFTYNNGTGKLGSPAVVCDTLPGGQDHNSQRMIIAPVAPGGTPYLFYASGDMGAGQFANKLRPQNAQDPASYEGKILRFNLEPDSDGGVTVPNAWIPNDNPYNALPGKQSAVYSIGIRNNQGFAYDTALNILYGSSHGPFSDDEINVIESAKNYGHPLVIGYASDNNVNNTTAGAGPKMNPAHPSSCPLIINESANAAAIPNYKDPLFSAYPSSKDFPSITTLWNNTTGGNGLWPSEGWSGLDLYTNKVIPGWKKSLVASGLKWGRLIRLKLGPTGNTVIPTGKGDTITYFQSINRYRDLAFAPNGRDIYVIMDNGSATSGPGTDNPVTPGCPGCLIKYTFLGYADKGGKSTIDTLINVTTGSPNAVTTATTVTIDGTNNYLWVPITGPDGDILAEIKANGNNLGTITSAFYLNSGTVREDASNKLYLDRNITITPQVQPTKPVDIRLYFTKTEFDALSKAKNSKGVASGVDTVIKLAIFKNNDTCGPRIQSLASKIAFLHADAHGNGYVLQAKIDSFSSFYFGNSDFVALPLKLVNFKGALENNATHLQWETANETNTSHFVVERSIDGNNFSNIGTVAAAGNSTGAQKYDYMDYAATHQSSSTLYYRLKMVDLNGDFTYSKVITIVLKPSSYTVALYPNPIHDVLKVRLTLSKAEQVQIQVTDMNGRIIYKESRFVPTGTNELKINTASWPSQLYSVRVTGTDKNILAAQNVVKL